MGAKLRHLEFIQGVINRLAANSFQMKGWAVVLVAAILVLLARENHLAAAFIALAPIVVFWGLDGYFLWQERIYRALYDHVRALDDAKIDFAMTTGAFRRSDGRTWLGATLPRTLLLFYGVLMATVGLATLAPMQGS